MANVVLTLTDYQAADGTGIAVFYPMVSIAIDDIYFAACASNNLVLSFDKTVDYFEVAISGKSIYEYKPGDTFASSAVSNANDMYTKFVDALTKP